jgi:hypothetical protein
MKIKLLLLLLSLQFFFSTYTQNVLDTTQNMGSIVVVSPFSGNNWYSGNTYQIMWSYPATIQKSNFVMIYLNSATGGHVIIEYRIPNTGVYYWRIPENIPPGTYVMVIKPKLDFSGDGVGLAEPGYSQPFQIISRSIF